MLARQPPKPRTLTFCTLGPTQICPWTISLDLLTIPIVASYCFGEHKVRFSGPDALFVTRVHEGFEVVGLRVLLGAVSIRISGKTTSQADVFGLDAVAHVSNICSAGSSVSSCSVIRYLGV